MHCLRFFHPASWNRRVGDSMEQKNLLSVGSETPVISCPFPSLRNLGSLGSIRLVTPSKLRFKSPLPRRAINSRENESTLLLFIEKKTNRAVRRKIDDFMVQQYSTKLEQLQGLLFCLTNRYFDMVWLFKVWTVIVVAVVCVSLFFISRPHSRVTALLLVPVVSPARGMTPWK